MTTHVLNLHRLLGNPQVAMVFSGVEHPSVGELLEQLWRYLPNGRA